MQTKYHMPLPLIVSSILLCLVYVTNYTLGTGLANLRTLFPFVIMPPGYVFAVIRSLIYILLFVFFVSLWTSAFKRQEVNFFPHQWFWLSCLFNIWWIIATRLSAYAISVFLLFWLFLVLWKILSFLQPLWQHNSKRYTFLWHTCFWLYLGWVMTASSVIGTTQLIYLFIGNIALNIGWQCFALLLGIISWFIAWKKFKHRTVLSPLMFALFALGLATYSSSPIIATASFLWFIFLVFLVVPRIRRGHSFSQQ